MHFILKRISQNSAGTFGVLLYEDIPFLLTLEREWKDNLPNTSCIPAGLYQCRRVQSPRFGSTFEVCGVEGRSAILFHAGNTIRDSRGCILLGRQFGLLKGAPALLSSRNGMGSFLRKTGSAEKFTLEILPA